MKTFHLTIAKVGENLFEGDALSVILPGKEGTFEVLADHEPFVAEIKSGVAHVRTTEGGHQEIALPNSGVVEISSGQATVLL